MRFSQTHLLGIQDLSPTEITALLDRANTYAEAEQIGRASCRERV